MLNRTILAAVAMLTLAAGTAQATSFSVGPNGCPNNSCFGGIYTLTWDPAQDLIIGDTLQTVRVTLAIDATGVNFGSLSHDHIYVGAVAVKVSSALLGADLFSAPDATNHWAEQLGGSNSNGCNGSGSGFDCVQWIYSSPSRGIAISSNDGILEWQFDLTLAQGAFINPPSLKVEYYGDSSKNGGFLGQVSENAYSVPEPASMLLLGTGLLGGGFFARRRKK